MIFLENYGKVRNCPFCKSNNIKPYRNGDSHLLYCEACGASSKDNSVNASFEKVASQWNRRSK